MNKKKLFIAIVITLVLIIAIAIISEQKTHLVSKVLDNMIADNKNHYLSCDQLPGVQQVDKVVREHKDVVEQIVKEVGKRYRDTEVTPVWRDSTVTDGESFMYLFHGANHILIAKIQAKPILK